MRVTAVSLRNVGVQLGSTQILKNISFDVSESTTLGILGANGSGKSTLIRAMLNIFPHTGTITLFDEEIPGRKVDWKSIGYAPQRVTSTAGVPATALEVVSSGLLYGRKFRLGKDAKERAMEALTAVGLAHRARESVQTFSGGQQQRVMLARALVRDPKLLFLDEPFSGVDRASRELITKTLTKKYTEGLTIIVVLHELQDLAPLIDKTIVLENGQIIHRDASPNGHSDPGNGDHHEHGDDHMTFRTPDLEGQI